MSPSAKVEYIETMEKRYRAAKSREEKKKILDEICATCGFHRKHAIRLVRKKKFWTPKPKGKRGRKPKYLGKGLLKVLKKIWLTANLPCSKRLKAMIPDWLPGYEQIKGVLPDDIKKQIQTISAPSIDRLLKHTRLAHTQRGRSTTKPGTLLRNQIPINTNQWQEKRPGFIEADTVAHCGGTTEGQYALTVDCVDIATGWTEQRAIFGKSEAGVLEQIRSIEKALPFPLLGFDSDNGSEFINHVLVRHFLNRQKPVKFTRSRAYKKDDNAHIEQKNWTHVRQWLGYHRLENPAVIPLMNDLYTSEWRLFHNFFCASVKLLSKERIGSKNIKKYDTPKTPYQRVLDSPLVLEFAKNGLRQIFENTNPFILRKHIETKLKRIFKLCYKAPVLKNSEELLGNINFEATMPSSWTLR